MRVLVCGGRNFEDWQFLYKYLDEVHLKTPITALINGKARGADYLGGAWAISRHINKIDFPANWSSHGKAAGPIRNQQMLDEGKPDLVLAFPGGTGTADMVRRAEKAGVPVIKLYALLVKLGETQRA